MDQVLAGPQRRHRTRTIALLVPTAAALTLLAVIGCSTATPVRVPEFSEEIGKLMFTFAINQEITPVDLPFAEGGSGALTYSLRPETPPGLILDAETGELTGTPTKLGNYELVYRAQDVNNRFADLEISVIVEPESVIRSVVSAVTVGDTAGVARFANLPDPSGGPSVEVTGNNVLVAGGTVFLNVAPAPGAAVDKLLVSIGEETFGYYEVDVAGAAAPHKLLGLIRFDIDPEIELDCVNIAAVDAGGAVGPATCHEMLRAPIEFAEVMVTVSWDSDADLDLEVVDGTGEAVYYGNRESSTGGTFAVNSSCGDRSWIRNEHIGWSGGTPPEGHYEVRLTHWWNCGTVEQTNWVVSVYNHGQVSTFSGTFTGPGLRLGAPDVLEISQFEVGDGPPPRTRRIHSTYRGHGDQVFVLNADGETLDKTIYTLDLGDASAEVYLIATNTAYFDLQPEVRRLDRVEAVAKGLLDELPDEYEPVPRPATSSSLGERAWITEFNNKTAAAGPVSAVEPACTRSGTNGPRGGRRPVYLPRP